MENGGVQINRARTWIIRAITILLHVPIAVPPLEVIIAWIEVWWPVWVYWRPVED